MRLVNHKIKYTILFIFICIGSFHAYGQGISVKDSLLLELEKTTVDTVKVELLEKLATEVYFDDPNEAIEYCLQMKMISEGVGYKKGMAISYGWLAYLYEQKGEIQLSLDYNFKAVDLLQQIGDKKNLGICYNNIAAIYKDRGDINKALFYDRKAIDIYTEIGNLARAASTLNNIGFIYFGQGKIKESLMFYKMSLIICQDVQDWEGLAISLGNIADVFSDQEETELAVEYHLKAIELYKSINDYYGISYSYNSIGRIYQKKNEPEKALFYFNECRRIREEIGDIQGIGYVLTSIGVIYTDAGKRDTALSCYLKSVDYLKEVDDPMGLSIVYYRLSEYYLQSGDLETARRYGEDAYRLSTDLSFPKNIMNASGVLYKVYERKQNWKDAFMHYRTYRLMNDSILNDETRKTAIRQQIQYEYDKKSLEERLIFENEKKIQEANLQKQRIALVLTAGILVLIIILSFVIYYGKKRSDNLLLNILPYETARELKRYGSAQSRKYDEVTVLFTDFKGFTSIAEKLSPVELVQEINECFSGFDKIIEKYHIEKIKTIGDAYMAAGGLPVITKSHASDVVKAAIEILKFMEDLAAKRKSEGKESFQIRIGIHTGPVVAGIVGIKKFAYDIWGDTVNIASRMESSGEPGKINISETTYKLVKDHFQFEYRGKIEAKNKGKIDMYFVVS